MHQLGRRKEEENKHRQAWYIDHPSYIYVGKWKKGIVQCLFVNRWTYIVTGMGLEIQSNVTKVGVFRY